MVMHTSAKIVNGLIAVVLESASLKAFILAKIFSDEVEFEINLPISAIISSGFFLFVCLQAKYADCSVHLKCVLRTVNIFLSFIVFILFLHLGLLSELNKKWTLRRELLQTLINTKGEQNSTCT